MIDDKPPYLLKPQENDQLPRNNARLLYICKITPYWQIEKVTVIPNPRQNLSIIYPHHSLE